MSKQDDEKYMDARSRLNEVMAAYIEAASKIGVDNPGIASDVCDSLYDASDGAIKLDSTIQTP